MYEEWVTIATVSDEIDANLKKGFLEDAGIRCVIEPIVYRPRSVVPILNQFKINVPSNHAESARQILSGIGD